MAERRARGDNNGRPSRQAVAGDSAARTPSGRRRGGVRIDDVAKAAGVSKALVSYALNGNPGVSDATRDRIVATATAMGWTPNLQARALSVSRAYAVGLVFQSKPEALASDQYFTSLMAGLQSVLSTSHYSLVTEVVETAEAERESYQRLARDLRVDGVILADLRKDDPRFAVVREAGLPFASLGWPPEPTTMPVLVYDERQAISDVVDHLVALGHTNIAQVVGPQSGGSARLRRELYQKFLRKHRIDVKRWVPADYTAAGGRAATARLLDTPPCPTAIIYSNDLMAIAGMSELYSRGLRIPQDVSVVGWDDITVSQYLHPALSTVTQHPFEDGKAAAGLLLEAIAGREFTEPVWTPNPRFIPRESSGPAPR